MDNSNRRDITIPYNGFVLLFISSFIIFLGFLGTTIFFDMSYGVVSIAIASVSGVCVALIQFARKDEYDQSQFYLEKAQDSINYAYDLLKDGNNDSLKWIEAARIIKRSSLISEKITIPAHEEFYKLLLDQKRGRFLDLLGYRGKRENAAFFCGVSNITMDLNLAVTNADQRTNGSNGRIPEQAIHAIHQFATFPSDYKDPLGDPDGKNIFQEDDVRKMNEIYPALSKYLYHIKN